MIKNTAGQKVGAQMVSATDGSAFTGSVTVSVTIDAGAQATGSVGAGACTHEGNGYHTYAPAQAETNGDLIAFTLTGTGAVPQTVQVYTQIAAQTGDSHAIVNSGTHGNAALYALINTEIADILVDTGTTLDDYVDDLETRLTDALATALQAHALGIGRGVCAAGSTTTAVVFNTVNGAAASALDDFYNGRHIVFTSGALTLQATSISDYTGATKTATVPALTGAPADTVTFIIV